MSATTFVTADTTAIPQHPGGIPSIKEKTMKAATAQPPQAPKPRYRYSHASSRWQPACPRSQHIGTMTISTHRGRPVIRTATNGIYKTRAAYVAEALGGRWSNRAAGYVMSSMPRANAAARLHAAGWGACTISRELIPPQGREWSASDLPRGARIAA